MKSSKSYRKSLSIGRSSTILVVDDDEGLRKTLSLFFAGEGYAVFVAENGKVALDLLKEMHRLPDLT